MVVENMNTSMTRRIVAPVRCNSVGKPAALNGGQNKNPDFRSVSTCSYGDGSGNSRNHSMGKSAFPHIGQNITPSYFRASTGSLHEVVKTERNSTINPGSTNSRESVIPHYLRASTGSCHDYCKYGRRHAPEVRSRSSFSKRTNTTPSDRQNEVVSGVPIEMKTMEVAKPKPSPLDFPNIPKQKVLSASKVGVSHVQASSNEKKSAQNGNQKNYLVKLKPPVKPKTMKIKPLYTPNASGDQRGGRKSEMKIDKTIGSSKPVVENVNKSLRESILRKPSLSRTVRVNVVKPRSLNILSPPKDQKRIRKAETKQLNSENIPEKTLHVIKVETGTNELESTQSRRILHSPASPLLPSPKLLSLSKSTSTSFHEDEAQEEFETTVSTIHFPPPQSLSSPKLWSLPKSPFKSFHEDEAQEELEYTDSPTHSPHQCVSSYKLRSLPKSPSSSFYECEAQQEVQFTENDIHSSPPQLLSSSLPKSQSSLCHDGETQDELECTHMNIHPHPPQLLSVPMLSSLTKSPYLSFHEGEAQEESVYMDNTILSLPMLSSLPSPPSLPLQDDKPQKLENTDSTIPSPRPELLSSPTFSSLPKCPPLSFHEDEAREEFEYTDSEADECDHSISESSEIINLHEVETSYAKFNGVPKRARIGHSEDRDSVPRKLKFRPGKVIELRPENSGPRRLKFRRGRVLGGKQDTKAEFRSTKFTERGLDDETKGANGGSGNVVLRHQDVEEKKDAQGLFNNVIEETACKLVESRKSKVQALVGAFETVISLQESKLSTQNVP